MTNKKEINKYKAMMQRLGVNMSKKSVEVWIDLMKETIS